MAEVLLDPTSNFVISSDREVNEAGRRIQDTIEAATEPIRPHELVRRLTQEGFSDELLRIAILYLIDYDLIQLTKERALSKALPNNGSGRD